VYEVTMKTSAQVGKTTTLLIIIGYAADRHPGPMLGVWPTQEPRPTSCASKTPWSTPNLAATAVLRTVSLPFDLAIRRAPNAALAALA
jgi:phage terminase large subunit GpA-like protein